MNRVRLLVLVLVLLISWSPVFGQDPAPDPAAAPAKIWSGSFGAGLALTGGNSDTANYNLSFDLLRDPKTKNLMKFGGSYLRGDSEGEATVDRLALGFRDEYSLSPRTFVYGDLSYLRDTFKLIDYLIAPTAGVGYRVYDTDAVKFSVNGGGGAVWEKNPGLENNSSGSVTAGDDFAWALSERARITQVLAALWKTSDFGDYLLHFGVGLAASITARSELKVEFLDDYKNLPASVDTKKNDTAFVTTFIFKF